tara:strand:- start:1279 stop:3207 length:1929 start_codon:yes stop_codon:yes gene_type:complete
MCGFVGLFGEIDKYDLSIRSSIQKSLNSFINRGPDSQAISQEHNCSIGFNRLSINNLIQGEQPRKFSVKCDDKSLICFNGEIFNYKQLEKEYLSTPYDRDEVQVLIDIYKRHGNNIFPLLNGQFSIAIYNDNSKKLILARDPFGIRPLFYFFSKNNSRYIFGSDLKGFNTFGINRELDYEQLTRLHLTWATLASKTIWKDIKQVEPGTFIEIPIPSNKYSSIKTKKFFDIGILINTQNKKDRVPLNNESLVEFRFHLSEAIRRQTMSDVGYTSYLSGGIDSSVIAYELSRLTSNLKTYSIQFDDPQYDESEKQDLIANHLNTIHKSIKINDHDITNHFTKAANEIQQPFFRTAPVPSMLLAQLIKNDHNKVALTGEGADEILLGYDIFRENTCLEFIKRKPNSRWRYKVFDNLYSYLPQFKDKRFRRLTIDSLLREGDFQVLNPLKSRLNNNLRTFISFKECDKLTKECVDSLINEYDNKFNNYNFDSIDILQFFEIENLLSGYLLSSQGDRVAMSASVETRYPYLDLDFVKYSFSIPRNHKLKGTFFKRILRKSYKEFLPERVINSPKIAYQAPEARAILKNKYIVNNINQDMNPVYSFYNYDKIKKIVNRIIKSQKKSRGSFGDNMIISLLSSLSLILNK